MYGLNDDGVDLATRALPIDAADTDVDNAQPITTSAQTFRATMMRSPRGVPGATREMFAP